jgi:hypothetical protein
MNERVIGEPNRMKEDTNERREQLIGQIAGALPLATEIQADFAARDTTPPAD